MSMYPRSVMRFPINSVDQQLKAQLQALGAPVDKMPLFQKVTNGSERRVRTLHKDAARRYHARAQNEQTRLRRTTQQQTDWIKIAKAKIELYDNSLAQAFMDCETLDAQNGKLSTNNFRLNTILIMVAIFHALIALGSAFVLNADYAALPSIALSKRHPQEEPPKTRTLTANRLHKPVPRTI